MFKKLEKGLVFNTDDIKRVRPVIEQEYYYSTSCGHSYEDVQKYVLDLIGKSFYITKKDYEELSEFLINENDELQQIIDKAIEYIETLEKREAYKIEDNENGVPELKVDNEEYLVLCKYNKLLNILKGEDK
jgi:hypothetical protein